MFGQARFEDKALLPYNLDCVLKHVCVVGRSESVTDFSRNVQRGSEQVFYEGLSSHCDIIQVAETSHLVYITMTTHQDSTGPLVSARIVNDSPHH